MARFIGGDRFITIQWLEKRQTEDDLIKPNVLRRMMAPVAVAGLIIWRSIGLSNLMDLMETLFAAGAQVSDIIVPLRKGEEAFQESTGYYIIRSLYTGIIAILNKLNLLV